MSSPLVRAWQAWLAKAELHRVLTDPVRLAQLEDFRQNLTILCGDEPAILQEAGPADGPGWLSLADDLGLFLRARTVALYHHTEAGGFQVVAFVGEAPGVIAPQGALRQWLEAHEGCLVRSELNVAGYRLEDAERLLQELEALRAEVVVPLQTGDGALRGLLVVGPKFTGRYAADELLRLAQHGCAILRGLARPDSSEHVRPASPGEQSVEALEMLWRAVRSAAPLRLLIVDEMPKAVGGLSGQFQRLGFVVQGCTTEAEALDRLAAFHPQLLLVDLSLHQRLPVALLTTALITAPEAVLIGMTTGYTDPEVSIAKELGVRHILRKPLYLPTLTALILEAGLSLTLGRSERSPCAS